MPAPSEPTVRKRYVGAQLRRLREQARLSREAVAAHLDCWSSKIGRIENGLSAPRGTDLEAMLDLYGTDDADLRAALSLLSHRARRVSRGGWWHRYGGLLEPADLERISMESEVAAIRDFETVLVPGLLQTEEYARAVMVGCGYTPQAAEPFVAVRMARQQILRREDAPRFAAVVDEAALHRCVGGPAVMAAQLRRLLEVNDTPGCCLRVLPFDVGAHPGVDGPFTVLSYACPIGLEVAVLEHRETRHHVERPEQVARYRAVFDELAAAALPPEDSQELIAGALRRHEQRRPEREVAR